MKKLSLIQILSHVINPDSFINDSFWGQFLPLQPYTEHMDSFNMIYRHKKFNQLPVWLWNLFFSPLHQLISITKHQWFPLKVGLFLGACVIWDKYMCIVHNLTNIYSWDLESEEYSFNQSKTALYEMTCTIKVMKDLYFGNNTYKVMYTWTCTFDFPLI